MKEVQPGSVGFLRYLDLIQGRFTKVQNIDPKTLHTKNREDLDLRILFLRDVLEKKIPSEETLYYHFITDTERNISRDPNTSTSEFIQLYHKIQKDGILDPLIVGRFASDMLKVRYIKKNKKISSEYKNENGLQLIDGAHRLAIALYLKYRSVPVKILKPISFQIPDYTGYIKIKRKKYLEKIKGKSD